MTRRASSANSEAPIFSTSQFLRLGQAPLYQDLAAWLERKIRSGEYPKGSKIPGDIQLADELGISVISVRAAMRVLIDKHLIARFPGKGTFVLNSSDTRAAWGLGSTEDLIAIGFQTSIKLLGKGYVRPPKAIALKFGQPQTKKLYWCRTLRIHRGEPFVVTDVYLPVAIGEAIEKIDLTAALKKKRLVNTVIQDTCHIAINEIKQTLGAELAGSRLSKTLCVPRGAPLLTVERVYFLADGTIVQVGIASHRVDHYRYTTNLKRVGLRH